MECILLIGIQASGKSTFYRERFFNTHVRINLDMLKTRHKEDIFLAATVLAKQAFVVDNTNVRVDDRAKYIELAKRHNFAVTGYYFEPNYAESVQRNKQRTGKDKVSEVGIRTVMKRLQTPTMTEGFDDLYRVRSERGEFVVEKMT